MRVKTSKYNPAAIGGQQGPANISFTGPLILHADPLNPKHAATKRYVDGRFGDLNAGDLKEGLLSVPLLPSFTGDVSNSVGSNIFTLGASGVTLGTYTKVTVDDKGRVVSGGSLENEDIPNLSWNKVIRNKPSNLNGYGVQGALPISGDTVGPTVELRSVPTDPLHAVNKDFLTSEVTALGSTASPGTVFRFSSDKTPEGFLRCSGGELDKETYSNLYSVIGDKFAPQETRFSNGKPWKNLKNSVNANNDIGVWVRAPDFPELSSRACLAVTKNKVHYLGGGGSLNTLPEQSYSAEINQFGVMGAWIPNNKSDGYSFSNKTSFFTKDKLYAFSEDILLCTRLDEEGDIVKWEQVNRLPDESRPYGVFLVEDNVYILAKKKTENTSSKLYIAKIYPNGDLGNIILSGDDLIESVNDTEPLVTKNKVYLLGGHNASNVRTNKVQVSNILEDGSLGPWSYSENLPLNLALFALLVVGNKVYIIGGVTTSVYTKNIYVADIDQEGTLGTFSLHPRKLTDLAGYHECFMTSSRIYIIGIANDFSNPTKHQYYASFTGGSNDYSQYYNGQHWALNNPAKFKLPDHTPLEDQNTYYYIKY